MYMTFQNAGYHLSLPQADQKKNLDGRQSFPLATIYDSVLLISCPISNFPPYRRDVNISLFIQLLKPVDSAKSSASCAAWKNLSSKYQRNRIVKRPEFCDSASTDSALQVLNTHQYCWNRLYFWFPSTCSSHLHAQGS